MTWYLHSTLMGVIYLFAYSIEHINNRVTMTIDKRKRYFRSNSDQERQKVKHKIIIEAEVYFVDITDFYYPIITV